MTLPRVAIAFELRRLGECRRPMTQQAGIRSAKCEREPQKVLVLLSRDLFWEGQLAVAPVA